MAAQKKAQTKKAANKKEASVALNDGGMLWYKDAVIYEAHVRAFYDSDDDGIGDFRGMIQKLDYLRDLGISAIWLLPFYPSPLRDDGYDIADYRRINPSYGTMQDFRAFLKAAHERDLKVISELVINHTSDQHEWFQKSRRAAPGSYWRDFYVWSDDPRKYREARIIFKDFEPSNWSWDPVAKSYYWHRFYAHQPDLNFDNPDVHKEIFKALDFWMDMGVDGMRLDAVPYLYEREGTSCENLAETHAFLKKLRRHIDSKYKNRMLLAEANQWPDETAEYFGDGDECHMSFHFPLMPRMFMSLKMEDRYSLIDILQQTPDIPETCQWATFLRNHDELTLEMVTDEERDFMYRAYASEPRARINLGIRKRLAPLLGNDRRQIELLNALLFSLPGTPVIYYGDEIGMGDNVFLGDRNGVRTPMQWSPDRNAGFSNANPQSLYLPNIISPEYHYETVNVETQQRNPNSLLWWMKSLIDLRRSNRALTRGSLRFLEPDNSRVLSFIREYTDEETGQSQTILVVVNLSKRTQFAELNLQDYQGMVPVELLGHTSFPPVGELPYFITLAPYAYHWFALSSEKSLDSSQWLLRDKRSMYVSSNPIDDLLDVKNHKKLSAMIAEYLPKARWFPNKSNLISDVEILDIIKVQNYETKKRSALLCIEVQYKKQTPERYLLTLGYAEGERAEFVRSERPDLILGEYRVPDSPYTHEKFGVYHEAIIDAGFGQALVEGILRRRKRAGDHGEAYGETYVSLKREQTREIPEPAFTSLDQSNSSLRFGKEFYLKIFRRLEEGVNPEVEIGRQFTLNAPFKNATRLMGSLTYTLDKKEYSLAVLHEFAESQRSAWNQFQDMLRSFAEHISTKSTLEAVPNALRRSSIFDAHVRGIPDWFVEQCSYSASLVNLLGHRTGEMHMALASDHDTPEFIPEDITPFYQRSLYQGLHGRARRVREMLKKLRRTATPDLQAQIDEALDNWPAMLNRFEKLREENFGGQCIRIHGDYHLGQVLFTGKDFIILDFEGEPLRAVSERRLKRPAVQDVAGMIRSIDYGVQYYIRHAPLRAADRPRIEPWLRAWGVYMTQAYIKGYEKACLEAPFLPGQQPNLYRMIYVLTLEKALYEIEYELGSRPDWVGIPLQGLNGMLRRIKEKESPAKSRKPKAAAKDKDKDGA